MHLTNNQLLHRAYIASDAWKAKRLEALRHYGCICNRCGYHGTDVHHKTYERANGTELMADLEVMCRGCHEAHHRAERRCSRDKKIKTIHRKAIYRSLSFAQMQNLIAEFPDVRCLYLALNFGDKRIANRAAAMLGCDYATGGGAPLKKKKRAKIEKGRIINKLQVPVLTKDRWDAEKNLDPIKILKHFRH